MNVIAVHSADILHPRIFEMSVTVKELDRPAEADKATHHLTMLIMAMVSFWSQPVRILQKRAIAKV